MTSPGTRITDESGRRTLMVEKQIKVLIVDDHSGVRTGIKNLLRTAKDMIVVGEGVNGAEAIELVATRNPDILLLDIELPRFWPVLAGVGQGSGVLLFPSREAGSVRR